MNTLKWLAFGILPALVFSGCSDDAIDDPDQDQLSASQRASLNGFMNALSAFEATCEASDDLEAFSRQRSDLVDKWLSCRETKMNFEGTKIEEKARILESCLDEVAKIWSMRLGNDVPLNEHGMLIVDPITTWRVELFSVSPEAFEAFQKIDEVRKAGMAKGVQLDETHRLWLQSVKSFAPYYMKEIREDCSQL